jgi:hypothetical protein
VTPQLTTLYENFHKKYGEGRLRFSSVAVELILRNEKMEERQITLPFRYMQKLTYCCGILNIDNWRDDSRYHDMEFKVFIHQMENDLWACGAIITTTNNTSRFNDIHRMLRETGFECKTFYNSSESHSMNLWTKVLHP